MAGLPCITREWRQAVAVYLFERERDRAHPYQAGYEVVDRYSAVQIVRQGMEGTRMNISVTRNHRSAWIIVLALLLQALALGQSQPQVPLASAQAPSRLPASRVMIEGGLSTSPAQAQGLETITGRPPSLAPAGYRPLGGLHIAPPNSPSVSTITVNTTADENGAGAACSLREALTTANNNSNFGGCTGAAGGPFTINVPAGTLTLIVGELPVGTASGANITINGAGSASTIIRQSAGGCSAGSARVFDLDPNVVGNVAVSISGVTISNGAAQSFGGGAILGGGTNDSLNLSNSILSNNCTNGANSAAGISWSPSGNVTITNTTFLNNISGQGGGAR